jgi:hypothetical protein
VVFRPNHELRIERAYRHLKELEGAEEVWSQAEPYLVDLEPDTESPYHCLYVTPKPVDPDPMSLLIGDCVHNLRSALDNLAFALAEAHTKPLPQNLAETSEFPIIGDEDRKGNTGVGPRLYGDVVKRKLGGVDPQAEATIESLQPYKRGNKYRSDPLWVIHDLDRIDKHRFPHLAALFARGFTIDPNKSRNVVMPPGVIESYGGLAEGRTKIARLPLAPANPRNG